MWLSDIMNVGSTIQISHNCACLLLLEIDKLNADKVLKNDAYHSVVIQKRVMKNSLTHFLLWLSLKI